MSDEKAKKADIKEKARHELVELGILFGYLAFFFCALATYSQLLLDMYHIAYFAYGVALINALVVAKVILIGEYAHLGKKHESKAIAYSAIHKAFLFGVLVMVFHFVEELIKRLVHGRDIAGAFREVRMDELLSRSLVIFCTFIPLFGFRELRRVIGDESFKDLFFRATTEQKTGQASKS
jgi:hypothetical protein